MAIDSMKFEFCFDEDKPVNFGDVPCQALFICYSKLYRKLDATRAVVIAWDGDYDYDHDVISRINNVHTIPLDLKVGQVIDATTAVNYPCQYKDDIRQEKPIIVNNNPSVLEIVNQTFEDYPYEEINKPTTILESVGEKIIYPNRFSTEDDTITE